MAEAANQRIVIVNEALRTHRINDNFNQLKQYGVRMSSSTFRSTCIFSRGSIAFLILDGDELKNDSSFTRIKKFTELHGKGFIMIITKEIAPYQRDQIAHIQLRMFPVICFVNFAEDSLEAIKLMTVIADMSCTPLNAAISNRVTEVSEQAENDDMHLSIVDILGLTNCETSMVHDYFGSLSELATASVEQLLEVGLNRETCSRIVTFFASDAGTIQHVLDK